MIENKHIDVIANLGAYKKGVILRRLLIVSVVAVFVYILAVMLTNTDLPKGEARNWHSVLFLILAFIIVSEVNIFLAFGLNRFPFFKGQILLQTMTFFAVTAILVAVLSKVAQIIFSAKNLLFDPQSQITVIIGIFLLIIMHIMIMMSSISREWAISLKEIDQLKSAKLQNDYSSLQDRLNPHFLFNNLSVLRSLIRYDAVAAEKFTENFTDVYRYVLHSHENHLVVLNNELKFLNAYIALHKERLSGGLKVKFNIDESLLVKELPPMSVQLLVENALKHNIASRNNPLVIEIFTETSEDGWDVLRVRNKINKKETTYSTKTGLKTLKAQITMISNSQRELKISEDGIYYDVSVPLL